MNKTNRINIMKRAFVRLNQLSNEFERVCYKSATSRRLATANRLSVEVTLGLEESGCFKYESREYAIYLRSEIEKTKQRFAKELAERQ